jgi:uncharacterized membrane protein
VKFFEHHKRSLAKTVTYRLLIIVSTFAVTYLITGNIEITIGVTFFANLLNTVLYYAHERVWNNIHWGKTKK